MADGAHVEYDPARAGSRQIAKRTCGDLWWPDTKSVVNFLLTPSTWRRKSMDQDKMESSKTAGGTELCVGYLNEIRSWQLPSSHHMRLHFGQDGLESRMPGKWPWTRLRGRRKRALRLWLGERASLPLLISYLCHSKIQKALQCRDGYKEKQAWSRTWSLLWEEKYNKERFQVSQVWVRSSLDPAAFWFDNSKTLRDSISFFLNRDGAHLEKLCQRLPRTT